MGRMANTESLLSLLSVWGKPLVQGCSHLTALDHPVPSHPTSPWPPPCWRTRRKEVELSMRVQTN